MKQFIVFLLAGLFGTLLAVGQSASPSLGRSSYSIVIAQEPNGLGPILRQSPQGYLLDQYDWNELATKSVPLRSKKPTSEEAAEALRAAGIGRQILAWVWNRQPHGSFSVDLLAKRGEYNATYDAALIARNGPRDLYELRDAGANLIGKSHVLFVRINQFETMDAWYNRQDAASREAASQPGSKTKFEPVNRTERGFRGEVSGWLFRLDYSDAQKAAFYDLWVSSDDSPADRQRKIAAFDAHDFPLELVSEIKPKGLSAFGNEAGGFQVSGTVNRENRTTTDEQLKREFCEEALDKLFLRTEDKTGGVGSLFDTHPIVAKIGRKEGVFPEKRFFIMEQRLHRDGTTSWKRRGVVRASSRVTDNRQVALTDSEPTRFKRTGGLARLDRGMALVPKPEIGFGVHLFYPAPTSEFVEYGYGIGIEANLSLMLGREFASRFPTGLRLGASLRGEVNQKEAGSEDAQSFARWAFYLRKEMPLASIFHVSPSIGWASETMTLGKDIEYSGNFIPVGAEFGMALAPPLRVFVQGDFSFPWGVVVSGKGDDKTDLLVSGQTIKWFDLYSERSQLAASAGLRFTF